MVSSPLYGRLSIIIAVTILLFLPLTFSTNNINNNALAYNPHCDVVNNYAIYDVDWCLYEREVENYPWCVQVWSEYNENVAAKWQDLIDLTQDISERCQLPSPPAPLHPLDCSQLNTCPTEECEVVPTSLNFQNKHYDSRILDADYIYAQDLPNTMGIANEGYNSGEFAQAEILPVGLQLVSVGDFCPREPPVRTNEPQQQPIKCNEWILAKTGICEDATPKPWGQIYPLILLGRAIDKPLQGWPCSILKDYSESGNSQFVDRVCRQQ